jgi:hypothetical protein
MHFACWITKAADTCSEYVILIAFPEHASTSGYTYTACLVYKLIFKENAWNK